MPINKQVEFIGYQRWVLSQTMKEMNSNFLNRLALQFAVGLPISKKDYYRLLWQYIHLDSNRVRMLIKC